MSRNPCPKTRVLKPVNPLAIKTRRSLVGHLRTLRHRWDTIDPAAMDTVALVGGAWVVGTGTGWWVRGTGTGYRVLATPHYPGFMRGPSCSPGPLFGPFWTLFWTLFGPFSGHLFDTVLDPYMPETVGIWCPGCPEMGPVLTPFWDTFSTLFDHFQTPIDDFSFCCKCRKVRFCRNEGFRGFGSLGHKSTWSVTGP